MMRAGTIPRLGMALAAAVFAAAPARALTLPRASFEELVRGADAIYLGEVLDKQCAWTDAPRQIVTRYRLRVTRTLKGLARTDLELTELGGVVGDDGMLVSGVPEYEIGERAVIFVHAEGGRLMTLRYFQGRFPVVASDVGEPLVRLPNRNVTLPLRVFAERVQEIVARSDGSPPW